MYSQSPVRPGDVINDKYVVEAVIGQGGMGMVVSARHAELGQRVALKFLLPQAVGIPGAVERFLREARAAVQLESQHVARVHDVGRHANGIPFVVMELLNGCDLGELVKKQGPLRIGDAVEFVIQACEAVAEAHVLGIVHRDLKPANLFLTRRLNGSPMVKVLDFGISKVTNLLPSDPSLTKTSDVIGSPYYMAPEQVRSARDVDARTDIWGLGVILYELLAGRVPFVATNMPQLCAMLLEQDPPPLIEIRSDVPAELSLAVSTCLRKRPEDRFQSVQDLVRAIAPFAATGFEASNPHGASLVAGPQIPALPIRSSLTLGQTLQQDIPTGSLPGTTTDRGAITKNPSDSRRTWLLVAFLFAGFSSLVVLTGTIWIMRSDPSRTEPDGITMVSSVTAPATLPANQQQDAGLEGSGSPHAIAAASSSELPVSVGVPSKEKLQPRLIKTTVSPTSAPPKKEAAPVPTATPNHVGGDDDLPSYRK